MKEHYKRGENLSEEQVNSIINEGYILHSVSVIPAHGIFSFSLVYHFTWDYSRSYNRSLFESHIKEIELKERLFSDINGNDTLGPIL